MLNKMVNQMNFAGSWYPDSAKDLKISMQQFAETVKLQKHKAHGAILPHAGHAYSGNGISHFFSNVNLQANRVIVLAPSHYQRLYPDQITCCTFDEYETPLGNIKGIPFCPPSDLFYPDNELIAMEHSAEMFYPFIKQYLPKVQLMVFLVPEISSSDKLEEIARSFAEAIDYNPEDDLIIASSDFTHYGRRFGHTPFGRDISYNIEQQVEEVDRKYANLLAKAEIKEMYKNIEIDHPTICGIYPAMLAAQIMNNAGLSGNFVNYYNSNRITAPSADFVCYASILFNQTEN